MEVEEVGVQGVEVGTVGRAAMPHIEGGWMTMRRWRKGSPLVRRKRSQVLQRSPTIRRRGVSDEESDHVCGAGCGGSGGGHC